MVQEAVQVGAGPERKDGGHPALCKAPPQWLRMRHQSHQKRPALNGVSGALFALLRFSRSGKE